MHQTSEPVVTDGPHLPSSSDQALAFMDHFDQRFQIASHSASGRIIAIASAHHRLNFTHPFPDGNGHVSRYRQRRVAVGFPESF
ncbi:MAG: Fic family protein [Paracoccaceae bacterium]